MKKSIISIMCGGYNYDLTSVRCDSTPVRL